MKSRALRALFVLLALAAQAAAGYQVWRIDERAAGARSGATDFDRKARLAVLSLAELRAGEQALVAEGQVPDTWLARVDGLAQATGPKIAELRVAATSIEAQAGLEAAVEAFSAFGQSDAKARDYIKSGQRLSASDVIFTDGASLLTKATNAIDTARGQESIAREIALADLRQQQLYWIGGAALVTLLALLLLFPVPKAAAGDTEVADVAAPVTGGLGISQVAPDRKPSFDAVAPGLAAAGRSGNDVDTDSELERLLSGTAGPDLAALADVCETFSRLDDASELQGQLERAGKALDVRGLIIWMPDGPGGRLRQIKASGYPPLTLARMGTIDPSDDNATAAAFRTGKVQVVPSEPHSSGAIVAPLMTPDGCSGTLSVELKEGARTTPQMKAVVTILAAQLSTLIMPAAASASPEPPPARP